MINTRTHCLDESYPLTFLINSFLRAPKKLWIIINERLAGSDVSGRGRVCSTRVARQNEDGYKWLKINKRHFYVNVMTNFVFFIRLSSVRKKSLLRAPVMKRDHCRRGDGSSFRRLLDVDGMKAEQDDESAGKMDWYARDLIVSCDREGWISVESWKMNDHLRVCCSQSSVLIELSEDFLLLKDSADLRGFSLAECATKQKIAEEIQPTTRFELLFAS